MSKAMRFYHNEKMVVKTLEELIAGNAPELAKETPMFGTGLDYQDTEVFEEDILSLKLSDVPENSNFWNQEVARVMKASEMNEVIFHIQRSPYRNLSYRVHMKRDNRWGSQNTVTNKKLFHESTLYEPCYDGIYLPAFLINCGAVVIGNGVEHPDLLPGLQYEYC